MKTLIRSLVKRALGLNSWNSDDDQRQRIPDAKTIFDVGANVGQTSKAYRRMFPSVEIWAFEPFQGNFEVLRRALPDKQFHPALLALSDQVGSIEPRSARPEECACVRFAAGAILRGLAMKISVRRILGVGGDGICTC